MHKRVDNFILALCAAFVFNLNPMYVVIAAIAWKLTMRSKGPKLYRQQQKNASEKTYVSPEVTSSSLHKLTSHLMTRRQVFSTVSPEEFDYVIVGGNISSLYSAALPSRAGQKCCVLIPVGAPPGDTCPEGWAAPVPLQSGTVGHAENYQLLLDTAQSLDSDKRVTFTPIGCPENNFAHTVVSTYSRRDGRTTSSVALLSGEHALATTLANKHTIDKMDAVALFQKVSQCYSSMTSYIDHKVGPDGASVPKDFKDLLNHSVKSCIRKICEDNDMFNSIAAAAIVGADEALPAGELSALALASVINLCEEGASSPQGGVPAIATALCQAVTAVGGRVIKDAPLKQIAVRVEGGAGRAVGVELEGGVVAASQGVLCGLGVLNTYCRVLPPKLVSSKMRESLEGCFESRPKIFVVLEIVGTKELLGISDCEYVETAPQDINSADEPTASYVAESYLKIWSPTARDQKLAAAYEGKSVVVIEMYASESLIGRAEKVTFSEPPVIGTTAAGQADVISGNGPVMYKSLRQSVSSMGVQIVIDKSTKEKLIGRAKDRLFAAYPLCQGKDMRTQLVPPTLGGYSMCPDVQRYNTQISATADVEGLYLCSSDLAGSGLQGAFQAGYLGASAAMRYTASDFAVNRNIISDLHNVPQ